MLTEERKSQIEEVVARLMQREADLQTPNFDLASFLSTQNDFLIGEQDMETGTTGILLVNQREKLPNLGTNRLILTSTRLQYGPDYQARRRFIVAHEYAHFNLHMNEEVLYAHRDTDHRDDPIEEEADFFARCLLMPRAQVESELSKLSEDSTASEKVEWISQKFGVTEKKARQRLKEDLKKIA